MSKGSKPRPVDEEKFNENFDRIFGKKALSSLTPQQDEQQDEGKRTKKATKKLRR